MSSSAMGNARVSYGCPKWPGLGLGGQQFWTLVICRWLSDYATAALNLLVQSLHYFNHANLSERPTTPAQLVDAYQSQLHDIPNILFLNPHS